MTLLLVLRKKTTSRFWDCYQFYAKHGAAEEMRCFSQFLFFRPPRKANYTRAVTTRGGYVETGAGNVVGTGNYSSRIIKTNRVGF